MTASISTPTFVGPEGDVRTAPAAPRLLHFGEQIAPASETQVIPVVGSRDAHRASGRPAGHTGDVAGDDGLLGPLSTLAAQGYAEPVAVREEWFVPRDDDLEYAGRHAATRSNRIVLIVAAVVVGLLVALTGLALFGSSPEPRSTYTDGSPILREVEPRPGQE